MKRLFQRTTLPGINGSHVQQLTEVITKKRMLDNLFSSISNRANLAARLGKSFGENRDLYQALGYPKVLTFNHYAARYERQDLAKRIVAAYPEATWRKPPTINEIGSEDRVTEFEQEWNDLVRNLNIYHYLLRADRISGIGEYGVLFLGFDDINSGTEQKLNNPVQPGSKLLYIMPYTEMNATISSLDSNPGSARYGQPEYYSLNLSLGLKNNLGIPFGEEAVEQTSINDFHRVHWTRVIHIAEGLEDNDVYGTPRLKAVYNRLQDVETIAGGSAEMFWQGAFPGMLFSLDKEFMDEGASLTDLQSELDKYVHKMQRYIKAIGMKATPLSMDVASPKEHLEIQLRLISAGTGIPERLLTGSERGELASSQDEKNWNSRVDERRRTYASPMILHKLIDRLILLDSIAEPEEGYETEWPDEMAPTEKEMAETSKLRMEALAAYINAPGATVYYPVEEFLKRELRLSPEMIEQIVQDVEEMLEEEREQQEMYEEENSEEEDYEDEGDKEEEDEEETVGK